MMHAMAKIEVSLALNCRLYNALLEACHAHQLRVIQAVKHEFFPQGLTAAVILSESHATIHTFPEWQQVYMDVFTCKAGFDPVVVCSTFAGLVGGRVLDLRLTNRLEGEKQKPMASSLTENLPS